MKIVRFLFIEFRVISNIFLGQGRGGNILWDHVFPKPPTLTPYRSLGLFSRLAGLRRREKP